jgi:uncharacterized OB-fold protein
VKGCENMAYTKPLPIIKGMAETFWNGLKEQRLLIQYCQDCAQSIFYPRVMCPHCGGTNVEFKEQSGIGEIYSYTVVHAPRHKGFNEDAPYVVALVNIEGGARMMTNIIDCEINDVQIGSKVKISFTDVTDEITLPHFKLI